MDLNQSEVVVIGLNRFKRYAVEIVPTKYIENIGVRRIYKPTVLEIMDYLEKLEGWPWRGRTAEDKKAVKAFVESWKNRQNVQNEE